MGEEQWSGLLDFAAATNVTLLFGLNDLFMRPTKTKPEHKLCGGMASLFLSLSLCLSLSVSLARSLSVSDSHCHTLSLFRQMARARAPPST